MASLPTIEEDCLDETTPERKVREKNNLLGHKSRASQHVRDSSRNHLREIVGYNSNNNQNRDIRERLNLPSARGLPPTNPRSADHYTNKKNRLLNQLAPNSDRSSEDYSTRVSSKQSHARQRAAKYYSGNQGGIHQSNTPAATGNSKASDLLPNLALPPAALPPLNSGRSRLKSQVMDPPFNYDEYIVSQQSRINSSRYGNRKNHVSEGMSIAMGGFRYDNASNAVRLARQQSLDKENIIYTPRSDLQMQRGPRP